MRKQSFMLLSQLVSISFRTPIAVQGQGFPNIVVGPLIVFGMSKVLRSLFAHDCCIMQNPHFTAYADGVFVLFLARILDGRQLEIHGKRIDTAFLDMFLVCFHNFLPHGTQGLALRNMLIGTTKGRQCHQEACHLGSYQQKVFVQEVLHNSHNHLGHFPIAIDNG